MARITNAVIEAAISRHNAEKARAVDPATRALIERTLVHVRNFNR